MSKTIKKGQFNTRLLKEVSETPTCNTTLFISYGSYMVE